MMTPSPPNQRPVADKPRAQRTDPPDPPQGGEPVAYDPFVSDASVISMPTVPKEVTWALEQDLAIVPVRIVDGEKRPLRTAWSTLKRGPTTSVATLARTRTICSQSSPGPCPTD